MKENKGNGRRPKTFDEMLSDYMKESNSINRDIMRRHNKDTNAGKKRRAKTK